MFVQIEPTRLQGDTRGSPQCSRGQQGETGGRCAGGVKGNHKANKNKSLPRRAGVGTGNSGASVVLSLGTFVGLEDSDSGQAAGLGTARRQCGADRLGLVE